MPKVQTQGRRQKLDCDGNIIVNMTVKNDDDFLSVYSTNEVPVISSEVAEFLENSTDSALPRDSFTLRIYSDCIDEAEKEEYASAIKEYYAEKYLANKNERKRNGIVITALSILGILVLALAFQIDHAVWSEVVDIAAWVLLWEAVDIGVFKNREKSLLSRRYKAFMSMKAEFYPLEKK